MGGGWGGGWGWGCGGHTLGQKFFTRAGVPSGPKTAAVFVAVVYMSVSHLPHCTTAVH